MRIRRLHARLFVNRFEHVKSMLSGRANLEIGYVRALASRAELLDNAAGAISELLRVRGPCKPEYWWQQVDAQRVQLLMLKERLNKIQSPILEVQNVFL